MIVYKLTPEIKINGLCGVYMLVSPSGKRYIGSSRNIGDRIAKYKTARCKSQRRLFNSLKKHGFDNHEFFVIEECELCDLYQRESFWGNHYDVLGENGLNCCLPKTGEAAKTISEETRARMRLSNLGRRHTDEAKARMSERQKGDKSPLWGIPQTQEHRDNISKANKGRRNTKTHNENISKSRIGDKHHSYGKITPESTRTLMSEANSKPVINIYTGVFYKNTAEAAAAHEVNKNTLGSRLRGYIAPHPYLRYA